MSRVTLRAANATDSEFAYSTKKSAFRVYVEQVWGWDEDEQRRLHADRYAGQDFRIIAVDGTDVGVVATATTPDCVKLNQLYLLPEHQGKGIGRRFMSLLMAEARSRGLPIRLAVLKVNPRARSFYERLGFVRSGETATHDLMEWITT
jgi:GNAT superfamily N-acetyltransferase